MLECHSQSTEGEAGGDVCGTAWKSRRAPEELPRDNEVVKLKRDEKNLVKMEKISQFSAIHLQSDDAVCCC